jgi:antitoxin component YwqK of YwqJK toxin-antitoxin module
MQTKINQYNTAGQKHGLWINYKTDGTIREKSIYKNGILDGPYKYNFIDKYFEKATYKNNKYHGLWQLFNDKGILIESKFYANN